MSYNAWEAEAQEAKARSLADRWSELSRKLRLDIEIQVRMIVTVTCNKLIKCVMQELDESGGYSAVEVVASADCGAGGIIQMRQVSDDICHYTNICPSDRLAVVEMLSLVFNSPSCRQGQQRRLCCRVSPVRDSGTLPVILDSVTSVAVGSPCVRSKLQRPLDSYQVSGKKCKNMK